jgi:hypothetical protein
VLQNNEPETKSEPLEGNKEFPLFEVGSRVHLNYLYDSKSLDVFRRTKAVVAAHRWLKEQGIDLIFVPVPKMTEVYVEQFVDPHPADGVIAPHARKALLELLNDGVEVVDLATLFRTLRDIDEEYLYNAAESHWAPRGMRIAAKEIADRVSRYKFGARARYGLPFLRPFPTTNLIVGQPGGIGTSGWLTLSPDQLARAKRAQTTTISEVLMFDGKVPADDPNSPLLVIGHSYVPKFREQLMKELNMLISTRVMDGATVEFFRDFLRDPQALRDCRVVVWITTEQHMTHFTPMPEPVMATLKR